MCHPLSEPSSNFLQTSCPAGGQLKQQREVDNAEVIKDSE
ncbi:unnamed protein product [Protopolystoma xenopodis]|uniref:Uncharacterized protein n=1 Tax=Protopolystoma xenopodis TaxID=117903 RepID=A0A448WSA1_9PLAT|nr:unnamed protein product [Protopolystoma xenopodis]